VAKLHRTTSPLGVGHKPTHCGLKPSTAYVVNSYGYSMSSARHLADRIHVPLCRRCWPDGDTAHRTDCATQIDHALRCTCEREATWEATRG